MFGPEARFPFALERKYTPCDAGKDELQALRDHLGFSRNVIVQATCHGADNRALVDALADAGDRARGVATVRRDVSTAELQRLDAAGVRGVRFNFVKRLVDKLPHEDLLEIAARIAPLGWHIVIYFEAQELDEIEHLVTTLPTVVVVDHMGRPDVSQPVEGAAFQRFVRLLAEHPNFWTKVSCPERLSRSLSMRGVAPSRSLSMRGVTPSRSPGPRDYEDVVPFARHLVERFPERVLWGTDWPHPNMKSHMPDDGKLVDFIPRIAPTAALRQALLVDNPMRLYWPDAAGTSDA